MNDLQILFKMHEGWMLRFDYFGSWDPVLDKDYGRLRLDYNTVDKMREKGIIDPPYTSNQKEYCEWSISKEGYKLMVEDLLKGKDT